MARKAPKEQLSLTDRPVCYRVPLPIEEGDEPVESGYSEVYRTPKYAVVCLNGIAEEVRESFERAQDDAQDALIQRAAEQRAERMTERLRASREKMAQRALDAACEVAEVKEKGMGALKERLRKGGTGLNKATTEVVLGLMDDLQ